MNCRPLPRCVTWCATSVITTRANRGIAPPPAIPGIALSGAPASAGNVLRLAVWVVKGKNAGTVKLPEEKLETWCLSRVSGFVAFQDGGGTWRVTSHLGELRGASGIIGITTIKSQDPGECTRKLC